MLYLTSSLPAPVSLQQTASFSLGVMLSGYAYIQIQTSMDPDHNMHMTEPTTENLR